MLHEMNYSEVYISVRQNSGQKFNINVANKLALSTTEMWQN